MTNHRLDQHLCCLSILIALAGATLAGCSDSAPTMPDGAPIVPLELGGTFSLRSRFALSAPPAGAAEVLAELKDATDGPDDPSRFVVDRLVAKLPEGRAQLVAAAVAPYIASYLQARIDTFAPALADRLRVLADGVNQIGRHFGTTGTLTIDDAGHATHAITGLGFEASGHAVDIAFAPLGMSDVAMHTSVVLTGGRAGSAGELAIAESGSSIPYGAILRLGLDRLVVPRVVPGASGLADAFVRIIDCDAVGAHVSEYLGAGEPALYAGACAVAMTRFAAEIYERLDMPAMPLVIAGRARASDATGDGAIDAIADGVWSGTFAELALGSSGFDGAAR